MLAKGIQDVLENCSDNQNFNCGSVKPVLFDLSLEEDQRGLEKLLLDQSIHVIDEIYSQLSELVKLRNPKTKFTPDALDEAVLNHLNGRNLKSYGNWFFYPWLNKLIHLLPKEEFIEVRTNRNQYKITPQEEEELALKKIGIIGLSVGKAIALTIALERICGELVLADFDVIELSNLNRIQTGVQNFGVKKTVVVAREIAEIDPYLKVTCFHDGLTEENVQAFFTQGGRLDICIEVCDGLYTKIFARQKAKELGVPVVMNSSDRGTTDIERFDLEPDLPILHGLIDHLDLSLVKQAKTNEEKVPYLLPMLGVETSSERLKASMLEIEETITTWPQLASGVVFGGGICTDVCRRILLGQFTKSGRYFVDTEKEINNEAMDAIAHSKMQSASVTPIAACDKDGFKSIIAQFLKTPSSQKDILQLDPTVLEQLVESACMAPSGGNIQPWYWVHKEGFLFLFMDKNRAKSILNYDNTAARIALGAASLNLELKASSFDLTTIVLRKPMTEYEELEAVFYFKDRKKDHAFPSDLVNCISSRYTNRMNTTTELLSDERLTFMDNIVPELDCFKVQCISDRKKMNLLKRLMKQVDRLYYTSKVGHESFTRELRWTEKEVLSTKDGVDLNTMDLTPTERAGFEVSKNWEVVSYLNDWNLGEAYSKLTEKGVNAASAVGVIVGPEIPEGENYFALGRTIQRLWLEATKEEVALQPMSIATFLMLRANYDAKKSLGNLTEEYIFIEGKMKELLNLNENERPVFIFRLTLAEGHKTRALRRPLSEVFMQL